MEKGGVENDREIDPLGLVLVFPLIGKAKPRRIDAAARPSWTIPKISKYCEVQHDVSSTPQKCHLCYQKRPPTTTVYGSLELNKRGDVGLLLACGGTRMPYEYRGDTTGRSSAASFHCVRTRRTFPSQYSARVILELVRPLFHVF